MTGYYLFLFMFGAFMLMLGLHNSIQLSLYPLTTKIQRDKTYQRVYAAAGMLVILGLTLMCAALRSLCSS